MLPDMIKVRIFHKTIAILFVLLLATPRQEAANAMQ
jgi:hypothetical protein